MRRLTMAGRKYLTTFSFRGRWVYVPTRRKWKRRNLKLPFGWVIVVSYRRVGDALEASEEIAVPDARGAFEHLAWWPEGCQLWPPAPVQAGRQDLRLPDRGPDQPEARSENGNDLETGISGTEAA